MIPTFQCPECGREWHPFVINPKTYHPELEDKRCRECRRKVAGRAHWNTERIRREAINAALIRRLGRGK